MLGTSVEELDPSEQKAGKYTLRPNGNKLVLFTVTFNYIFKVTYSKY